jgi:hypothetical protein
MVNRTPGTRCERFARIAAKTPGVRIASPVLPSAAADKGGSFFLRVRFYKGESGDGRDVFHETRKKSPSKSSVIVAAKSLRLNRFIRLYSNNSKTMLTGHYHLCYHGL